jgi:adenosylcobyric acid synthase
LTARALMVQGAGSDVGKSLLVAGLCRIFTRRGLRVRPFKPQNMSNNAAVAADGGEIGRAQALQALACGVPPVTDMNPVLLKPQSEVGAQVVVRGRVHGVARAREYQALKGTLLPAALESFARLSEEADLVLVEGAGGAAEINLRTGDIANMGFAEAADLPVVLVGDIERGGVIAQIVGTCVLLSPADRARLRGYVVNKFRGDVSLFAGGIEEITRRTGLESFGVVPYYGRAHRLPAEDSVAAGRMSTGDAAGSVRIAVPILSRIANFDDLDPLRVEDGVRVEMVAPGQAIPGDADLVVLCGSKATLAELAFLREQGWDIDLLAHRRRGGRVLGICGGFQMLGRTVADPSGIEGAPGTADGLGLLDVTTEIGGAKRLCEAEGREVASRLPVRGYEMHMGITAGPGLERPFLRLTDGPDGAVSADGRVMGCYLHGLFAADPFRRDFLARLGRREDRAVDFTGEVQAALDGWADHLEGCLAVDRLLAAAGQTKAPAARRAASAAPAHR